MITCPECGASNGDGVKFCDRCGQGLAGAQARPAAAASLAPLAPGTELKGGLRVVELIGQTAHENRYRAQRPAADGTVEHLQLREQIGPPPVAADADAPRAEAAPAVGTTIAAPPIDDPAGPRAKTADLKLKATAGSGSPSTPAGGSGGLGDGRGR